MSGAAGQWGNKGVGRVFIPPELRYSGQADLGGHLAAGSHRYPSLQEWRGNKSHGFSVSGIPDITGYSEELRTIGSPRGSSVSPGAEGRKERREKGAGSGATDLGPVSWLKMLGDFSVGD